jgi:hypothetical protein
MSRQTLILALVLGLLGCNLVESPLSDVPINDPNVLQIIAVANREMTAAGGITPTLKVNLYDKHGEYVKIMDGAVMVNGKWMHDGSYGAYVLDTEPVRPLTRYTFTVIMSDGSRESCAVRTPADLTRFDVPASANPDEAFTITWSEADGSLPLTVDFAGDTASVRLVAARGATSMRVMPPELRSLHPGQVLRVTASYVSTGGIYGGFMSTSRVSATFSVVRSMRI